ncbi:MAG: CopD family protein [Rhizobacter sp.]|nr:CopD family protein [Rhizobacter sp.]
MDYALLKMLHWGGVMVWMGGMFFALFCLRPAAGALPPPVRVPFMADVLGRFFNVVLWAALAAVASGGAMMARAAQTTHQTGAPFNVPLDWLVMAGLGVLMLVIYGFIRLVLHRRLQLAVAAQDWPAGGAALNEIRFWVAANLSFGAIIIAAVVLGTVS